LKEKQILKAIKKHVNGQNNNWKFIYGRKAMGKEEFLEKIDKDRKFQKFVVDMVVQLSIDILTRK